MPTTKRSNLALYAVCIFRLLLILIPVAAMLLSAVLWAWPYNAFLNFVLEHYHLQAQAESVRNQLLSGSTYHYLRYGASLAALVLLLLSMLFYKRLPLGMAIIAAQLHLAKSSIGRTWFAASHTERRLVVLSLILVSMLRIALAIAFPVHIDEAFGYVFIIDRGVLATLAYYPGPNNHIGYNIFPALLSVAGCAPLWSLRLPVLLIATLFSCLYLLWAGRYWGFKVALGSHLLFAFSWQGLFYSTHGRGYFLQLLCLLLSVMALQAYFRSRSWSAVLSFAFVSAWGLWAVPTYVYPLAIQAAVWCFWVAKGRQRFHIAILMALAIALAALLYSPAMLLNGANALLNNAWVKGPGAESYTAAWLRYLPLAYAYNYPLEQRAWLLTLLLWFLLGFYLYKEHVQQPRYLLTTVLAGSLLPALLIYLQKVLPFVRVWLFRSALEYMGWAYVLYRLLGTRFYYVGLGLCMAVVLYYNTLQWQHNFKDYRAFDNIAAHIAQMKQPPRRIFTNYDLANVMLRYRFGGQMIVHCPVPEPSARYDLFIYQRNQSRPDSLPSPTMPIVYSDHYVLVFGHKEKNQTDVVP